MLVTNSLGGTNIHLDSITNVVIQGNYIGTDITGTISMGSQSGIIVENQTALTVPLASNNILIGGSNPGEGNLVSGHALGVNPNSYPSAIFLIPPDPATASTDVSSISNVTIRGNYFGLTADGLSDIGPNTFDQVDVSGTNIVIGGIGINERNVFSGNDVDNPFNGVPGSGLLINEVEGITVKNNYFGTDKNGVNPIANNANIVIDTIITNGVVSIGGSTPVEGNLIANALNMGIWGLLQNNGVIQNNTIINNQMGIVIFYLPSAPEPKIFTGAIINNKIYNNTALGINIVGDFDGDNMPDPNTFGPNLNDISDSDSGSNNNLNYPVISSITESPAGTLNLTYFLDVPAGSYRIEFYKNPTAGLDSSYHGEGEEFVFADTFVSTGTIGTKRE
jgi:hypothetical protein